MGLLRRQVPENTHVAARLSVVSVKVTPVQPFAEALEEFDSRSLPWGPPTGLAQLDELAGGMVPGRLWVVVGEPDQGRTTLLVHLAARWALVTRGKLFLSCPREPTDRLVARLLSHVARESLGSVLRGRESDHIGDARVSLSASGLVLSGSERSHLDAHAFDYLVEQHGPAALLVDDVDLVRGAGPGAALSWTHSGAFVCVTLPRHLVVRSGASDGDLDPHWSRAADLIMDVRTRGHGVDPDDRAGEADLAVIQNRWGPHMTITASYQPYYSRFVDIR